MVIYRRSNAFPLMSVVNICYVIIAYRYDRTRIKNDAYYVTFFNVTLFSGPDYARNINICSADCNVPAFHHVNGSIVCYSICNCFEYSLQIYFYTRFTRMDEKIFHYKRLFLIFGPRFESKFSFFEFVISKWIENWLLESVSFSVAPLIGVKRPNACNLHLPTDHTRRQAQGESEAMYSDSGAENDPLLSKGKPQPQRQKAKPLGSFSN